MTPRIVLPSLSLAVLLLVALPLGSASRAQEVDPQAEDPAENQTSTPGDTSSGPLAAHPLIPGGEPSGSQARALERARLERELVLAERSAQMLQTLEEALAQMKRDLN